MTMGKAIKGAICVALISLSVPTICVADTESDLSSTVESLESKREELGSAEEEMARIQSEIDAMATEVSSRQQTYQGVARELSATLRSNYKCSDPGSVSGSPVIRAVLGSEGVGEFVERIQYADSMTSRLSGMARSMRELSADLEKRYAEISAKKDEQEAIVSTLNEEIPQLESQADELRTKLDEERASYVSSSNEAAGNHSVAGTFDTGSTDGWRTGVASAYGGWSDPSTGAVSSTATGDICDDWSMGVAVPMAWPDYRSYFNRQVEISYGGQSVIAVVNDCGYMGGGSRSLDLQPGVFKAFGFSDCDSWGLRTVSFRFL